MLMHPPSSSPNPQPRGPAKRRGSYNCGRCGLPKKGHVCTLAPPTSPPPPPPPRSDHRLRRALSFDNDDDVAGSHHVGADLGEDDRVPVTGGGLPVSCLAEILRRLSPRELMRATAVSRGWREAVKRVWISAEEVKLRVSPSSTLGFVGSVLHKCEGLARLTLTMERLDLGNFWDGLKYKNLNFSWN